MKVCGTCEVEKRKEGMGKVGKRKVAGSGYNRSLRTLHWKPGLKDESLCKFVQQGISSIYLVFF